jgi:hypothetical protein
MHETTNAIAAQRPDAVVWIDEGHAIVARLEPEGRISSVEIRRLQQPENRYLGHVVHEIGNREHVLVVGPEPIRVALERRYVSVSHRPDRLIPAPPTGLERLVA